MEGSKNTKAFLTYRIGFSFPMPIIYIAGILILFGLIACIQSLFAGLFIIISASFVLSCSYGTEIDLEKQIFREYSSIFGLKKGNWTPLEKLPFITVLMGREGLTMYSRSNRSTTSIDDRYGIYFLSETHRTKVLLQKFSTSLIAMDHAKILSQKLNKEIVKFSPVVSEKTQQRRRRR